MESAEHSMFFTHGEETERRSCEVGKDARNNEREDRRREGEESRKRC